MLNECSVVADDVASQEAAETWPDGLMAAPSEPRALDASSLPLQPPPLEKGPYKHQTTAYAPQPHPIGQVVICMLSLPAGDASTACIGAYVTGAGIPKQMSSVALQQGPEPPPEQPLPPTSPTSQRRAVFQNVSTSNSPMMDLQAPVFYDRQRTHQLHRRQQEQRQFQQPHAEQQRQQPPPSDPQLVHFQMRRLQELRRTQSLDELLQWFRSDGSGGGAREDGGGRRQSHTAASTADQHFNGAGIPWSPELARVFLSKLESLPGDMPHILRAKRDMLTAVASQWVQQQEQQHQQGSYRGGGLRDGVVGTVAGPLTVAPSLAAAANLLARIRVATGDSSGRSSAASPSGGYTPGKDFVLAIALPLLAGYIPYGDPDNALAAVRLATEVARVGLLPPLSRPVATAEGKELAPGTRVHETDSTALVSKQVVALWFGVRRLLRNHRLWRMVFQDVSGDEMAAPQQPQWIQADGIDLAQHVQAAAWLRLELGLALADALTSVADIAGSSTLLSRCSSSSSSLRLSRVVAEGSGGSNHSSIWNSGNCERGVDLYRLPATAVTKLEDVEAVVRAAAPEVMTSVRDVRDATDSARSSETKIVELAAVPKQSPSDSVDCDWAVKMSPLVSGVLQALRFPTEDEKMIGYLTTDSLAELARRFEVSNMAAEATRRTPARGSDGAGSVETGTRQGRELSWAEMRVRMMHGNVWVSH